MFFMVWENIVTFRRALAWAARCTGGNSLQSLVSNVWQGQAPKINCFIILLQMFAERLPTPFIKLSSRACDLMPCTRFLASFFYICYIQCIYIKLHKPLGIAGASLLRSLILFLLKQLIRVDPIHNPPPSYHTLRAHIIRSSWWGRRYI